MLQSFLCFSNYYGQVRTKYEQIIMDRYKQIILTKFVQLFVIKKRIKILLYYWKLGNINSTLNNNLQ